MDEAEELQMFVEDSHDTGNEEWDEKMKSIANKIRKALDNP